MQRREKLMSAAVGAALLAFGAAAQAQQPLQVELSGQVNRAIMHADDGIDSDLFNVDNDNSGTRFRFKGTQSINANTKAGVVFEVGGDQLGLGTIALFLVLRGFDLYGAPRPWRELAAGANGRPGLPAPLAFLHTTKYPASLSFLLMTLGPTLALLPLLERMRGAAARALTVFGRVPFFFYVLHIPLIHALALVVSKLRTGAVDPWLFANHPMGSGPPPEGYAWSLPLLYLVWAIAVAILYFACRWYVGVNRRRREWWLSYL